MEPDTLMRDNIFNHWGVIIGEKRSYKQYTREFKEEAVALATNQGYSAHRAQAFAQRE